MNPTHEKSLRVALLGCGNVGRELIALVAAKEQALRQRYGLAIRFSGGLTRRAGAWESTEGVTAAGLAASEWPQRPADEATLPVGAHPFSGDGQAFAATCPADVLVELTTLEPLTGQPALDHIRAALTAGRSVVTANKGPIANAYRELRGLAEMRGVTLRFESTVMDGTPIFNMAEAALPATDVLGFRGLLNCTSNFVLSEMARGASLEEGIARAQRMGVAEADPSNDLDGWDASVKATVLANALMDADMRPQQVTRIGLGAEAMRQAQASLAPGQTLKQVVEARRDASGAVIAEVRLRALPPEDVFAHLVGRETAVRLLTDTMGALTIIEGEGGPEQTALGVLADIVAIGGA
ncbi:MAG TPA: hypothetical protein VKQ36_10690 [Ktedonobacterales bacterium]|nr:hypothetical protein [Ktedonobacterales bacterium]